MLSPLTGSLGPLGKANKISESFANYLINTLAFTELWKCTDVTDSTVIASVDSARNGTQSGWNLQQLATPTQGESGLAPDFFTNTNTSNILTASLTNAFNLHEGTLVVLAQINNAANWVTAGAPRLFSFLNGTAMAAEINKLAPGTVRARIRTGGQNTSVDLPLNFTASPFMITATWRSLVGGFKRVYWNANAPVEILSDLFVDMTVLPNAAAIGVSPGSSNPPGAAPLYIWYAGYKNTALSTTQVQEMFAASGLPTS